MATRYISERNDGNLYYRGVTYYESRDDILSYELDYMFTKKKSTYIYDVVISALTSKKF